MTGDPIDRTLVQPAAEQARDDRSHRLLYLAGALVVVGVLGLAVWAWLSIDGLRDDVAVATGHADTATSSASDAASRAQRLYDQVVKLGGTPVVQPPPPVAVGPAGATGATGPIGPKGDKGDPGTPGESPPCLADPAHCQGAAGAQGITGTKGDPGDKGDKGDPGQAGQDGKNGQDGVTVTRQYFDRNDAGECHNFTDFSDGRTRVDQGPAGDAACPAPATPPPTQTTPAILPPGVTKRRRD
jgi:hypothetical protein